MSGIVLDIDGTLIDSLPWPGDSSQLQPSYVVQVGCMANDWDT